jgi:hypothetical protein
LIACLAGIGAFHLLDARSKGESLWPVVLSLLLVALILTSVFTFARRPAPGLTAAAAMRARAAQVVRIVAPLAALIAVVAAIAQAFARP